MGEKSRVEECHAVKGATSRFIRFCALAAVLMVVLWILFVGGTR